MLLEIYGHRRLAGRVTEIQFAGTTMAKIEVPPTKAYPEGFEQCFSGGAIFSCTEISEEVARAHAEQIGAMPPRPYQISQGAPTMFALQADAHDGEPWDGGIPYETDLPYARSADGQDDGDEGHDDEPDEEHVGEMEGSTDAVG